MEKGKLMKCAGTLPWCGAECDECPNYMDDCDGHPDYYEDNYGRWKLIDTPSNDGTDTRADIGIDVMNMLLGRFDYVLDDYRDWLWVQGDKEWRA